MNWLDSVLVIAIAISALIGVKKGVIGIALTLAGLVLGVFLAGRYYILLSQNLFFISHAGLAKVAAFAIIFIGVMAIAGVLARLLGKAASAVMMGWANRIGGGVLGGILGAIFCGAFLAMWVKFLGMTQVIVESRIAPVLLSQFPRVLALLPGEFDAIRSFFQ